MQLNLTVSEACHLRYVIAQSIQESDKMIRKYTRYTYDHRDDDAIEDFYSRLSQLQTSQKRLHKIDEILSEYIGDLQVNTITKQ